MSIRDKYTDEEWDALEAKIKEKTERRLGYERVIIMSDDDGHEYIIPYHLKSRFLELNQVAYLKEDWDLFEKEFGSYICGGDPFSENEFYIKSI